MAGPPGVLVLRRRVLVSNIYGKGARGKATMLHSVVVRSRGACERCGRPGEDQDVKVAGLGTVTLPIGGLQAAHIVSRRYAATRTDERNGWALCAGCHRRLTEHPNEHVHLAVATLGQDGYDELCARALAGGRSKEAFWVAEVDRLTQLLKDAA